MSMRWPLYALAWGLALTSISLVSTLDVPTLRWSWAWWAPAIVSPQITAFTVLAACAAAARFKPAAVPVWVSRTAWVAVALLLDALMTPWLLYDCLGWQNWGHEVLRLRGEAPPGPGWTLLGDWLGAMTLSALAVGLAGRWQLRGRQRQVLAAAAAKRDGLRHALLQARFAAMQAHVEPEFLFDTLRDFEQLYNTSPQRAAALIDALIAYLRLALPGLRGDGQAFMSTLGAEIELVSAWLEVMGIRGEAPVLVLEVAPGLKSTPFSPMLLLPLIQSLVRRPLPVQQRPPSSLSVSAQTVSEDGIDWLTVTLTCLCDNPSWSVDEGVRERLANLFNGRASIAMVAREPLCVEMRIPIFAEGLNHADRTDR